MKKWIFILCLLLFSVMLRAQYVGWGLKKIERNLKWECNCSFEYVTNQPDKAVIVFSKEYGVEKMVFYFDKKNLCYGYSVYCNESYEPILNEFIRKNYKYNKLEDYYENSRSYLFYQSNKELKIIHIVDRFANGTSAASLPHQSGS